MPSCRITNHTSQPLNICLKQVTALHFENGVQPGQTIKFRPGKVWFTLEALADDETKKSRYSILKSAATIALLSVAVGAVAATAGAALLPEAAVGSGVAAASVAGGYLAKGMTVTKTALVSHSGTIAKLSSVVLPKAIDKLSAEVGGLTALQREVLSIVASPTLSSDVRHRATGLLRQMHSAYSGDKAAKTASNAAASISKSAGETLHGDPTPSAVLTPLTAEEAEKLEADIEAGKMDDQVEHTPIRTGETLRVHGIYMKERREFEIRTGKEGRLELWNVQTGQQWE